MKIKAFGVGVLFRALAGVASIGGAAIAVPSAVAQDQVAILAAAIETAVKEAQAKAEADGLSEEEVAAAIEAAVQNAIALSGVSPAVAQQALSRASAALTSQGFTASAITAAISSVSTQVASAAAAPGATGGSSGNSGAPGPSGSTGGSGGGGGYSPVPGN